jgi:hypothetical protein
MSRFRLRVNPPAGETRKTGIAAAFRRYLAAANPQSSPQSANQHLCNAQISVVIEEELLI